MSKIQFWLPLLSLLLVAAAPLDKLLSTEKIQKLLERSKFEEAATAAERVISSGSPDEMTWYQLAYASHCIGNYPGAIEAGKVASGYPAIRASALYNLACSYSLNGDLEEAVAALTNSIASGFVDMGLIETDADLALIREANRMPVMPPRIDYQIKVARNRLKVPYHVLLPDGFDASREYPFVIAFAPGSGQRTADWFVANVFGGKLPTTEFVTVVVAEPENAKGWINHPVHHALEDLYKELRKNYRVRNDRFHFLGFGSAHRPAEIYSQMSAKYVDGLIVMAGSACEGWDDDEIDDLIRAPFTILIGSEDMVHRAAVDRVEAVLGKRANFKLQRIEGGDYLIGSLRGQRLAEALGAAIDRVSK